MYSGMTFVCVFCNDHSSFAHIFMNVITGCKVVFLIPLLSLVVQANCPTPDDQVTDATNYVCNVEHKFCKTHHDQTHCPIHTKSMRK